MNVTFTIPGPPTACQRPRIGKGGAYMPRRTIAAERAIGALAIAAGVSVASACSVTIRAYFGDMRRRDLDNVAKTVLDGLATVLPDDNWTIVREVRIIGYLDRANPRTVVTVEDYDGR